MRDDHKLTAPIERITDSEVTAIIKYLDPTPTSSTPSERDDTVIAVVVCVFMLLIGMYAFISLYVRTS